MCNKTKNSVEIYMRKLYKCLVACCIGFIVNVSVTQAGGEPIPQEVVELAATNDCYFSGKPEEGNGKTYLYGIFLDEPKSLAVSCMIDFTNYLFIKSEHTTCNKKLKLYGDTEGVLSIKQGLYTLREHDAETGFLKSRSIKTQARLIKVSWGEGSLEIGLLCQKGNWYSVKLSGEIYEE